LTGCRKLVAEACSLLPWCRRLASIVAVVQGAGEAHGFFHTVRVLCNALRIAENYRDKVDLEVLVAATLLHDIGRSFEEEVGVHHAIISAHLAEAILPSLGFGGERCERVKRAILEHSFSLGLQPSSLESCILRDADRLDALGVVGFYRMIETGVEMGRTLVDTIAHYWEKLEKLPDTMCTSEARVEAARRLEALRLVVEKLRSEILDYEDAVAWLYGEVSSVGGGSTWRKRGGVG